MHAGITLLYVCLCVYVYSRASHTHERCMYTRWYTVVHRVHHIYRYICLRTDGVGQPPWLGLCTTCVTGASMYDRAMHVQTHTEYAKNDSRMYIHARMHATIARSESSWETSYLIQKKGKRKYSRTSTLCWEKLLLILCVVIFKDSFYASRFSLSLSLFKL